MPPFVPFVRLLHSNELESIGESIGSLKNLTSLDLTRNKLSALAPGLGSLRRLRELDLRWNELSALPPTLSKLTNLERLFLAANKFTAVPDVVATLTRLEELDVYNNRVRQMTAIASLDRLTSLNVARNKLKLPSRSLCDRTGLVTLKMHANSLAKLAKDIGRLTQLRELSLYGNVLRSLPRSITRLSQLETLNLRDNLLVALPSELGALTGLTSLSLRGNRLRTLPDSLGQLVNLQVLNVSSNVLSALPESLGACVSLESINCAGNLLTELPASFARLHAVRQVVLDANPLAVLPSNAWPVLSLGTIRPLGLARSLAMPWWLVGHRVHWLVSLLCFTLAPLVAMGVLAAVLGESTREPEARAWIAGISFASLFVLLLGASSACSLLYLSYPYVPALRVRLSLVNAALAAGSLVQVLQLWALAFEWGLAWPRSLSYVTQLVLVRFGEAVSVVGVGWAAVGAALVGRFVLCEALLFARWTLPARLGGLAVSDCVVALLALLTPPAFIPLVRNLAAPLACAYWQDGSATLHADRATACWAGSHYALALACMLALLACAPTAVLGLPAWQSRLASADLRCTPRFVLAQYHVLFALAVCSVFLPPAHYAATYLSIFMLSCLVLAGLALALHPFGPLLWKLDLISAALYLDGFLAGAFAAWARNDPDRSPWVAFTAAVVAMSAVLVLACGAVVAVSGTVRLGLAVLPDAPQGARRTHEAAAAVAAAGDDGLAVDEVRTVYRRAPSPP